MLRLAYVIGLCTCLQINITYAQQDTITPEIVHSASRLIDMQFSAPEIDSMLDGLRDYRNDYQRFHQYMLANADALPLWFDPVLPGMKIDTAQKPIRWNIPKDVPLPVNHNELAYYSILQLAGLLREKKISSEELTRFFIDRLKKYGPLLHCVVSIPEEIAMQEARKADEDFAKGIDRGPLQGIPYGVKDLFAVKGTYTTWGTPPYRNQRIDETAYVVQKLQAAGAVLVAKLSLGELAMDDVWFGGLTRNPWDTAHGSSGSSAGSAAATVAGLVPFALGTETWGSIVSPSTVCGALGLRPTFGSISRTGAMTLAWSSDKIGPLCRTAEDAAIVFAAIHGTDGIDKAARFAAFNYLPNADVRTLTVAYASNWIDTLPENHHIKQAMRVFQNMGVKLIPIVFPDSFPADAILGVIVGAESAAAFDPLTRSHRDSFMVQQRKYSWPNQFRTSRFIPAVEYINAQRLRYQIMQQVDPSLNKYYAILVPTFAGQQLALTNLTGHPVVSVPDGFRANGTPTSFTLIGKLFGEAAILELAQQYQLKSGWYKHHPPLFSN
ncbi:amidase [Thermoflavifilum thermophilum]|uniref:Asp-tRNAAsn/Glu-tRNAGln amidotransferase A subunit n=1 Tax=Thermoflavifilum thermophilum TaxID=1393122 RepID=A0A1I7NHU2_9BACT|nr:amidase [Thermoflavifilum thermophilum]SFV34204.1 Asp-tRNAAsn/Glu-tRNAGln amidotransferase A subunit [Thermoflavifilum thermophilum]